MAPNNRFERSQVSAASVSHRGGGDDWDKTASFAGNATPRRSTSSLAAFLMRTTSFKGWLIINVFLCLLFSLFVFGAVTDHLVIPAFRGGPIVILEGKSAWAFVAAFASIWLGQTIRIGMFTFSNRLAKAITEIVFLTTGFGLLLASFALHKYLR
jgi:hypothetical protein